MSAYNNNKVTFIMRKIMSFIFIFFFLLSMSHLISPVYHKPCPSILLLKLFAIATKNSPITELKSPTAVA